MILGKLTPSREAVVQLKVRGPSGVEADIACVIDTGYTEYLTLPLTWIDALGLIYADTSSTTMADGSVVVIDLFEATIVWDGQARAIVADRMECAPLIGMSLLYDHLLTMEVVDGGPVTIAPLP